MGKSIMRIVEIPEENLDIFDKFVQLAKGKIITHSFQKTDDDIAASHKEFFSKYVGIVKGSTTDEEAKTKFINDYIGAFKIDDNAKQEYNQHRVDKYGK